MIWFTADLHLGHGNIIKYCHRPFLTPDEQQVLRHDPRAFRVSRQAVEKHDTALLNAINERVMWDDELWIVGDFCSAGGDAARYRDRIACRSVHLVWGNHDATELRGLFDRVLDQGLIQVDDQPIWLNHYPSRSWLEIHHGSWHLYGHVHGRLEAEDRATPWRLTKDVGVDACGYRPWSFTDLKRYMKPRLEAFDARKGTANAYPAVGGPDESDAEL